MPTKEEQEIRQAFEDFVAPKPSPKAGTEISLTRISVESYHKLKELGYHIKLISSRKERKDV